MAAALHLTHVIECLVSQGSDDVPGTPNPILSHGVDQAFYHGGGDVLPVRLRKAGEVVKASIGHDPDPSIELIPGMPVIRPAPLQEGGQMGA
jgi:hypothetical protein